MICCIAIAILPLLPAASARASADSDVPVGFCRSGGPAQLRVIRESSAPVVLRAFGRTWTKPTLPDKGVARISVPEVRVPTLFQVVTSRPRMRRVAELIAYPKGHSVKWPASQQVFVAKSAPGWLREWFAAVRLPLREIDLSARSEGPTRARVLLVVARVAAGARPASIVALCRKQQWNLLVLDAAWFGKREPRDVSIAPRQMQPELGALRRQTWSRPLRFSDRAGPWRGVVNRRSWIQHDGGPLVEDVSGLGKHSRIVLSYVPWQRQLGRNEFADDLFVALLRAAASPATPAPAASRVEWLWPGVDRITAATRPVASSAVAVGRSKPARGRRPRTRLWVLDVRGSALSRKDAAAIRIPILKSPHDRLLVLGVDPRVAGGRWSGKRQPNWKSSKNPADEPVLWLKDDALPSSPDQRIVLMQVLTRLGIRLGPIDKPREQKHVRKIPKK